MKRLLIPVLLLPAIVVPAALAQNRIALWDVCRSAWREGSLDASIVAVSVVANDFARFYARYRAIELICFNGRAAAAFYRRHVQATLAPGPRSLPYQELPSTSPANAALGFEVKLERWRAALAPVVRRGRAC